jgi:hypothetical protein
MASHKDIVSSFIEGAPPGEVKHFPLPAKSRCASPCWLVPYTQLADVIAGMSFLHPLGLPPVAVTLCLPQVEFWHGACLFVDIKALTLHEPSLVKGLGQAFEKYNEEQFTTVKLPGGSQQVVVSSHSALGGGRYFDVESSSSFEFDHVTRVGWSVFKRDQGEILTIVWQKASAVQSYVLEGSQSDLV